MNSAEPSREHRQREADEAVAAELQQHAGEDHRARGRRLDVGVGQPGVDRPHRQLDREAGEEGEEQPLLRLDREIVGHQRRDRGRVRRRRHVDHGDQHQHRAEQGVEEEFVARLDPLGAAPDADDQVHRDQAAFEEDVEQEQVLRREDAEHQRLHQQEGGHIFGHALLDRRASSRRCRSASGRR